MHPTGSLRPATLLASFGRVHSILLLFVLVATPQTFAARTIAQWESMFLGAWQSEYNANLPRSTSGDSWNLYDLAYAIDANNAMFRATGSVKTQYLDRALLYITNVISTARVSSSFPNSQYKDSYLTWVNHSHPDYGNDGKEYALFESYLWRYVTRTLRAMKVNATIMNNPAYKAKYDSILAFSEKNIWEKWYSRGLNDPHIYRQRTHMASHWAFIAMNLNAISTNATKKAQYVAIRDNITYKGMPEPSYPGASLRGQMQTTGSPARFFWDQIWLAFNHPGQDVDHGNAVIAYVTEAKELGYHWTATDMNKFIVTLNNVIWPSATTYKQYVDGAGMDNGWFVDGWVTLGRYSASLQTRLESHTGAGATGTQFLGNGALNAKLLGYP